MVFQSSFFVSRVSLRFLIVFIVVVVVHYLVLFWLRKYVIVCHGAIIPIRGRVKIWMIVYFVAARTSLIASRTMHDCRVSGIWLVENPTNAVIHQRKLRDGVYHEFFFVIFFRFAILKGFLLMKSVKLFTFPVVCFNVMSKWVSLSSHWVGRALNSLFDLFFFRSGSKVWWSENS